MRYLLDTCVISELVARNPNKQVIDWIDSIDPETVYLSVITIGEIRKGIEKFPGSKRKAMLREWLEDELLVRFGGRILPVNLEVILVWGQMIGHLEQKGMKMPALDSLIAAIVLQGNLNLATRNENDFKHAGIQIVNPWKATTRRA